MFKYFKFISSSEKVIIMHDRISAVSMRDGQPSIFIFTGNLCWQIDFTVEEENQFFLDIEIHKRFEKIQNDIFSGSDLEEFRCDNIQCYPIQPNEIE